jgi:hypothetical protein
VLIVLSAQYNHTSSLLENRVVFQVTKVTLFFIFDDLKKSNNVNKFGVWALFGKRAYKRGDAVLLHGVWSRINKNCVCEEVNLKIVQLSDKTSDDHQIASSSNNLPMLSRPQKIS